jgi:uncharacterized SAM-binding protein YcdF (DUF218 family)
MTYTQPLILLFAMIALAGLARLRHCRGLSIPTLGVLGLVLVSWPPAAWLFSRPLEAPYPVRPPQPGRAQAIVVLSSSVESPVDERPYSLPDEDTFRRCEFAAWLFRREPALPVLACGGPNSKGAQPYSATMSELLQRAGVPKGMIWTEELSHSTHENAVYGAELLRKHGIRCIALVVEAQSMLRAEKAFRKQGIDVVPAPCSFRRFGPLSQELIPNWRAIRRNETTLHEGVGLVLYWSRGWI